MNIPVEERTPYKDLTTQIEIQEIVGQGAFSTVHRGKWVDTRGTLRIVAVKILRPANNKNNEDETQLMQRRLNRESRLWGSVDHPYVLRFLGIYQPEPSLSAMVSSFCPQGNVVTFLKNRPNINRPLMISRISQGLNYLHSRNIIHGDLKGNNVLIQDETGIPLLSDFGRSRLLEVHGVYTTAFAGASRYLAPELMAPPDTYTQAEQDNFTPNLTKESDVYGFGMVGLEILTDKIPFAHIKLDTMIVIMVNRGRKPARPQGLGRYHDKAWDVLDRCWEGQPASRPVIAAIVRDMPVSDNLPGRNH
ncbi:kinase-like domain-containing protein [Collybia nuda]|uniref:Kinase-like domain-containing protein n=1 Tax=Collybia nuda TaxID=64659 RepID=A0A9P5YBC0_9AGAR|nr:kinase-like domain-containing protein [Collybia nuda]